MKVINIVFGLFLFVGSPLLGQSDICVFPFAKVEYVAPPQLLSTDDASDFSTFESLPGSANVIYLDFDGEYVMNSTWNSGAPINAAPSHFSDNEKLLICKMVASDFEPFDVNITTKLSVYNAAPKGQKQQVIFTKTEEWYGSAGGVAKRGTFDRYSPTPCWVFQHDYRFAGKTASHEIGHTLYLHHAGTSVEEYYNGHGDWNAIMGNRVKTMMQWTQADYPDGKNSGDEVLYISRLLPFLEDDWSSSLTFPASLGNIVDGFNNFSGEGLIGKQDDQDIFIFSTSGGNFNLNYGCAGEGMYTNLRLEAQILNIDGSVLFSDATSSVSKIINTYLPAGTYYLKFDGIGYLTPLTGGYSDYGSLGKYQFSGKVTNYAATAEIAIIGMEYLPKQTCTETVKTKVYVQNIGSQIITDYDIKLKDSTGDKITKVINKVLNANEIDTVEFEFTPSNFHKYAFTVDLFCSTDNLLENNSISSDSTNYIFGEELLFELTKASAMQAGKGWNWKVLDSQSNQIITSNDFNKQPDSLLITEHFCLPKDSCYSFEVENPFITNWCGEDNYIAYYVYSYSFDHIFQIGDSVIVFGLGGGFDFYELLQEMTAGDVQSAYPYTDASLFKKIECPIPDEINDPHFSLIRTSDGAELYREAYTTTTNVFTKELCMYDVVTAVNPKKEIFGTLKMYPNPSSEKVFFEYDKEIKTIQLFNTQGELVLQAKNSRSIDVRNIAAGVYFARVNQEVKLSTLVVIK